MKVMFGKPSVTLRQYSMGYKCNKHVKNTYQTSIESAYLLVKSTLPSKYTMDSVSSKIIEAVTIFSEHSGNTDKIVGYIKDLIKLSQRIQTNHIIAAKMIRRRLWQEFKK